MPTSKNDICCTKVMPTKIPKTKVDKNSNITKVKINSTILCKDILLYIYELLISTLAIIPQKQKSRKIFTAFEIL